MGFFDSSRNTWSFIGICFFLMVGTYNAVVINSESSISGADMRFVKRLDEIYGNIDYNRNAASTTQWQKLGDAPVTQVVKTARSAPAQVTRRSAEGAGAVEITSAAVQENLQLNLVEVMNPKKYKDNLSPDKFTGSLETNNGVIESLSVSLPNGEGLSVSFSEMSGNVFEYDMNGELYSAMMYQVDTTSYMVTLTNGPMEGTRLKFTGAPSQEQTEANEVAKQEAELKDDRQLGNDGADTAQAEEIAFAEPATNAQEAFDRDAAIQAQQAQILQVQEIEQAPGFYDQIQGADAGQQG